MYIFFKGSTVNSIVSYRNYQFDGELYVRCAGDPKGVKNVKYTLLNDSAKVQECVAVGAGTVTFHGLAPGKYVIEGEVTLSDDTVCQVESKIVQIDPGEVTRTYEELFASNAKALEAFKRSSAQSKNSQHVPLKGRHAVAGDARHRLVVKFKEGKAPSSLHSSLSVYREYAKNLKWVPVYDQGMLSEKRGRLQVLKRLIPTYYADFIDEGEIGQKFNAVLLNLAIELESDESVEYCDLASDVRFVHPELFENAQHGDSCTQMSDEPTPDFTSRQYYLKPPQERSYGMNVLAAHENGWKGAGAVIRHLDFGVYEEHEDLKEANMSVLYNESEDPLDLYHGTNSVGVIIPRDDGKGVTGIAYEAQLYFYRTDYMAKIVEDMSPGDIVSLDIAAGGMRPIVHSKVWWDQVSTCVEAGVTVIFAAGNNMYNLLESPEYFDNWGNSGGIMISGCYSNNGWRVPETNYNLYETLNSWANPFVTTTGLIPFGDRWLGESYDDTPNRTYNFGYGGTSAATPLVAGSLAVGQGRMIKDEGIYLSPAALYAWYYANGYTDAEDGQSHQDKVGRRPNVFGTLASLPKKYNLQ